MDLCEGDNVVAEETMYFCQLRGLVPAIVPTVGHAFVDMGEVDRNREAMAGLFAMKQGDFGLYYPTLDPVNKDPVQIRVSTGIAGLAADAIIEEFSFAGRKKTIAAIIAEASVIQARWVLLEDEDLEGLNARQINTILAGRNLATLKISNRLNFYGYVSGQRDDS